MNGCWWRPFHEQGQVAIVHVDLAPHADCTPDVLSWLDQNERERWQGYRRAALRREFARCRAALRAVLCQHLGCSNGALAFAASKHGKPFAVVDGTPAGISFNVSHSGSHGLIAVTPHGRIGVDVEERRCRPDPDGAIRSAFAPAERAELAAAQGPRKVDLFFALWTMKEALLKARGVGLALDTSEFEIPFAMRRGSRSGVFRFADDPTVKWRLENLGNTDFAAAVAHELAPRPG